MSVGVLAFGAYLPQRRLQRETIAAAHSWFDPSLAGLGHGERTMASWDEDSNTLSVEAARACLGERDRGQVDSLYVGSTSFPFLDRQNAALVGEAMQKLPVYALQPDLQARGIAPDTVIDGIELVDYDGFVKLTTEYEKTQSWL